MANVKKRKLDSSNHDQHAAGEDIFVASFKSCKRQRCDNTQRNVPLPLVGELKMEDTNNFCIGKSAPSQRKRSFREKLARRVSRYLMKSKLKRLEDYSSHKNTREDRLILSEAVLSDQHYTCHLERHSNSTDIVLPYNFSCSNSRDELLSTAEKRSDAVSSVDNRNCVATDVRSHIKEKNKRFEKPNKSPTVECQSTCATNLQHIIDSELRIKEECLVSMFTSGGNEQTLDAVRRFHVSNARVTECSKALKLQQTFTNFNDDELIPCKAKVCLSNIRVPLMWKDADYFSNKGDYRRYAVFCLVKVGHQVESTSVLKNIDRTMTDLTFNDIFVFSNVDHDFEVNLEIYCHKLHGDLSMASTPIRVKKRLTGMSSSLTRHFGKAISGLSSADVTKNMILGPKFDLVAKGTLHLQDADASIATHDLVMNNLRTVSHDIPLFGCYCCRLAVQPHCLKESSVTGYLQLQCEEDDIDEKHVRCELKNGNIECQSVNGTSPIPGTLLTIPVTRNTKLQKEYGDRHREDDTGLSLGKLTITNEKQYSLASESESLLCQWWIGLQQHWINRVYWKQACEQIMDIQLPFNDNQMPRAPTYDEISINEL